MITAKIITHISEDVFQQLYNDSEVYLLEGNVDPALKFSAETLRISVNGASVVPNGTIILVSEDVTDKPLSLLMGTLNGTTFDVYFCLFARDSDGTYTKLYNITVAEKQALMHPLGIQVMRYHVYGRNLKLALITKGCSVISENESGTIMIPEGFDHV